MRITKDIGFAMKFVVRNVVISAERVVYKKTVQLNLPSSGSQTTLHHKMILMHSL